MVIAHRGFSSDYPENTLLAFREAILADAEIIEMDVWVSSDGIPVVIHDSTLDRTTNGTGTVSECQSEYIFSLDAGESERIPSLSQALSLVVSHPEVKVLLDIKCGFHQSIVKVISESEDPSRIIVMSGDLSRYRPELSRLGCRFGLLYDSQDTGQGQDFLVMSLSEYESGDWTGHQVFVYTVNCKETADRLSGLIAGIITDNPLILRGTLFC